MSGRVIRVDPVADARWDRFVAEHPRATLHHGSAWLSVLRRTFGYAPVHLAYESGGAITGILPLMLVRSPLTGRRLVSLPFSHPVGPLGSSPAAIEALVGRAVRATSALACRSLRIHGRDDLALVEHPGLLAVSPSVCSIVPLQADPATAWRRLPRQQRGQIHQAERRGVRIRLADREADLVRFYDLFVQTNRKHGHPPAPYRLFETMWESLRPTGSLILFLAELGRRPIGASLYLAFNRTMTAFGVGVDYAHLRRYHAVRLLNWASIEWGCLNGYERLDLLRSPVGNAGLRWFKRSFGAYEVPMRYYYYPPAAGAGPSKAVASGKRGRLSSLARELLKRVPPRGLRLIGEATSRHLA